jgi:hypothetical protein
LFGIVLFVQILHEYWIYLDFKRDVFPVSTSFHDTQKKSNFTAKHSQPPHFQEYKRPQFAYKLTRFAPRISFQAGIHVAASPIWIFAGAGN